MARKTAPKTETTARGSGRRIVTTRDELPLPPSQAASADDPEQEEEPLSDFEIFASEFEREFELAVFRMDPKAVRGRKFVGALPGSRDSFAILMQLQENYGGGTYELRVREPGGTFAERFTVEVEEPKKKPEPPAVQMQEQVANIIKAVTEPMQQQMQQMQQLLVSQSKPMTFDDLLAKANVILPLIASARGALGLGGPAPVAATDPLSLLRQMQQLKEGFDAAGLGDREPDMMDRLMTLFTRFQPLLEKAAAAQLNRGPQPRAPRAAPAPLATAGGAAPAMPVPTMPAVKPAVIPEELKPFLPSLALAARNGETVESVGERILTAISALPEETEDVLFNVLSDGSLVSALMLKPEFAGAQSWLNALAQYLVADLSSAEETEEESDDVSVTGDENASGAANAD